MHALIISILGEMLLSTEQKTVNEMFDSKMLFPGLKHLKFEKGNRLQFIWWVIPEKSLLHIFNLWARASIRGAVLSKMFQK